VVVEFENGVEKARRMGGGDAGKERMRCFANDAAGWCDEDQEWKQVVRLLGFVRACPAASCCQDYRQQLSHGSE
jgi:hypothetical protein